MRQQPKRMMTRRRQTLLAACAGAAAAALFAVPGTTRAVEEVIYDLRVTGGAGGGKAATVSVGAPTVNLALFAYVLDLNGDATDTGFNSAQGAWMSSNGGLRGDFTAALTSPYDSGAAQNPSPVDRDGDGDLDVGNIATASSGFWIASSGPTGNFTSVGTQTINDLTYRVFEIGTGTFSLTNPAGGTSTQLNFVPRNGDALVKPHKYFKDSASTLTSINGNDTLGRLAVTSAINITLGGDNYTWTRGAGTNDWGNAGNWNLPAVPNSTRDSVTFGSAGAGQVMLNANRTVAAVNLTSTSGAYTFHPGATPSGTLFLNNGSGVGTITQTGSASASFNPGVTVSAGTLDVVTSNAQGEVAILGTLSAQTVNKSGTGALTLGNVAGSVTNFNINDGVLRLTATPPVQNSTLRLNGGTLALQADGSQFFSRPVVVTANSTISTAPGLGDIGGVHTLGSLSIAARTLTVTGVNGYDVAFDGPVFLTGGGGAAATFNVATANSDLRLPGAISGTSNIVKTGAHVMVIEGSAHNTYTGTTFVNGGKLVMNKPAGINAVGANVTVNNTGTLEWLADEQIPDSATLTLNAGGTVSLNGNDETVANFIDNGGTQILAGGQITVTGGDVVLGNGTVIGSDVSLGRDLVYNGTTTAATVSGNIALANTNVNHNFNIANGSDPVDVHISGSISGMTNVVKSGAGTLRYAGAVDNTNSGASTVSAGVLELAKVGVNAIAGPLEINGAGTVRFINPNQIADGASVTIGAGGTLDVTSNSDTIGSLAGASGGTLVLGNTANFNINQTVSQTFAGVVTGNGSFNKFGPATLTLTGTSSAFTGSVWIAEGAVRVASDANLGASSTLFISSGGTLATTASFTTAKMLSLSEALPGATPAAIDVAAGTTFTATGAVGAGGPLLKLGAGTMLITGAGEMSAAATMHINAGTVAFAGDRTTFPGQMMRVNAGGTLDLSASTLAHTTLSLTGGGSVILGSGKLTVAATTENPTFSGQIGGVGSFAFDGTTALTLSGTTNIGGTFEASQGEVSVTGAASVIAPIIEVNSGGGSSYAGTLNIAGAVSATTDVRIAGNIPGGAIVNAAAGGTLAANGDLLVGHPSAGAGALNIAQGATVTAGNSLKLRGTGSTITLDGGTLVAGSIGLEEPGLQWLSGTLRVTNGVHVDATSDELGPNFTVGANRILETGDLTVGDSGGATLTISAGGTLNTLAGATAVIGDAGGATGNVSVTGAGSSWNLAPGVALHVGQGSFAILDIANGASVLSSGDVFLGNSATGNGTVQVSGGARLATTASVTVGGNGGTGSLFASGGDIDVADTIFTIGSGGMSVANGTISANALVIDAGSIQATASGGGIISIGAGGVTSAGGDVDLARHATNPGRLLLGGTFTYNGVTGPAAIASTGGAGSDLVGVVDLLGGQRTFDIANGDGSPGGVDLVVDAVVVNGGITKTGPGTMALIAPGGYDGPTDVQQGELLVQFGSLPSATALAVVSGAAVRFTHDQTIGSLAGTGAVYFNGTTMTIGDQVDTAFSGTLDGTGAGVSGKLVKEGNGTLDLGSDLTGIDDITVNLGTLRLAGGNGGLTGVVNVTGTGPTQGTLALASDNLGSASLNLAGGRVRYEGSTTVARPITLGVGGGTFETISVVNVDAVLNGTGGLTKTGPGTLALMQAATYDGATNIMAGTLQSQVANAIPSDSEIFIEAGATLALGAHNQSLASITGGGAITMAGATLAIGGNDATTRFDGSIAGAGALHKNGSGAITLAGPIDLVAPISVNAGTIVFAGANTSTGGITVASGGAVSVGAAGKLGAASNGVTLQGGTLRATGSFVSTNAINLGEGGGTIDVPNSSHTLTHLAPLGGATTLSKSGGGTLRLEANPASLSGPIKISGGALSVGGKATLLQVASYGVSGGATLELDNSDPDNNHGDRVADNAVLTLGGGTLNFKGGAAGSGEIIGALHLAPGQSSIAATSGAAELRFLAPLTMDAGASLNFDIGPAGDSRKLFIAGIADGPVGAWATVTAGSETRFAKYSAAGGLVGLADGDYSLNVFEPNANVRMSSGQTHNAETMTLRTLTMNGAILGIDPGRTLTIATGGVIFNGQSSEINGPVGETGSITSGTDMLHVRVDGNPAAIHAKISGPVGLTKSGAGNLELGNNQNDFTGGVHLNAGALRISDDRQLGVSSPNVPNGNDIFFNGGTLWGIAGDDLAISAGRELHFNGGGGRLFVAGNGVSISLDHDGQVAGSGTMTKDGSGTLRIRGANAYHGPVNVAAGRLELAHVSALGGAGGSAGKSRITMGPGTFLDLRSDGPFPANFGNDIDVLDNAGGNPATITTASRTGAVTAGQFQLNDLNIGNATLATGGTGGSLAFTGIVTLTGDASFNAGRDLLFADRVTGGGSLTKLGSGKLTLGSGVQDTAANTYAGVTNIAGGVLELNKAAGTVAIPGDIIMSGGTLVLLQPRQISDNSSLLLTGGRFDLGGQSDSIQTLNNAGAEVVINGATLTVGTTTITGGTTTIGAPQIGGAVGGAAAAPGDTTVASAMVTETLRISSGTTTVNPAASLEVRSGGLFFEGNAAPQITLVNHASTPGKLLLRGDVTSSVTPPVGGGTGLATIASSTATPLIGTIDMGDLSRTFTVSDANSTLAVTAKLTRGGIRKSGAGKLLLTAAGDYAVGTTVSGGTLEAYDNALGTGAVTLSGGNLNLRSNAALATFRNDLVTSTATVDIGRITDTGPATGTIQLRNLTIGASRLRVRGLNGGTLEFTGPAALTGGTSVIDNTVPTILSNAISGPGALTKDFGAATLTFSGPAANTYAGATRVNSGVLQLNKSAGVTAVAGNLEAFTGGQVQWQNNDQVADTAALTVNGSASRIDLKDFRDTVTSVDLAGGTIATGTNGLLRVNAGITSYPNVESANITGNIELAAGMHAVHTTNVPKPTPAVPNPAPVTGTAAEDLIISANISGPGGITKTGSETLVLSGQNSFTGGLVVQGGTLKTVGPTQFSGHASLDVSTTFDLPGNFTTAPGAIVTKSGVGTLNITGPQSHGAGAQLVVQQGALTMNTNAGGPAARKLTINATGGSVQLNNTQHLAALSIGNGVNATVSAGGNKVIVADSLAVTGTGKINLNDNHMIVAAGSVGRFDGAAYTGLSGRVVEGYNYGSWDGPGITVAGENALNGVTTLAIATGEQIRGLGPGDTDTFLGETITASSVILMHTYAGDANLDGQIDAGDYGILDAFVQIPFADGYANGDFNYDGFIDAADYGTIDNGIQVQGMPIPTSGFAGGGGAAASSAALMMAGAGGGAGASATLAGVTAVPEPASFALVASALAGTLLRRRRHRRPSV